MSTFAEIVRGSTHYLVNVDSIRYVSSHGMFGAGGTIVFNRKEELSFAEPYESLAAKILAATAKEEREKSPHTPLKEKEEAPRTVNARARGKLTCDGFAAPQTADVKAFAATIGIDPETAEEFWYNCDATGWKHKGSKILNWRSMLQSWHRARKRFDRLEAERTAHIDEKMDEREAKRGKAKSAAPKSANWVGSTPEQRKEFCDGLEG